MPVVAGGGRGDRYADVAGMAKVARGIAPQAKRAAGFFQHKFVSIASESHLRC